MQKAHDASKNNKWHNFPDITSPIIAEELNRLEQTIDVMDDREIVLDTTKANQSDLLQTIKTVSYVDNTGTFTFTLWNGTKITINTDIEKVAVNFDYDDDPTSAHYQNLVITLDDGTVKYVDLSALITQYEFVDSSIIDFTIAQDGSISATIKNGSIGEQKLEPNFLANCRIEVSKAEAAADNAEAWAVGTINGSAVPSTDPRYHNNSKYYSDQIHVSARDSEAWAVGKRDGTDVPSTDPTYENNAKYWAAQAQQMSHGQAANISYNNSTSGMSATNAQAAVDELAKPTFTQASTRANISSGESFKTIFGKIKKWFADLKAVAFSGAYSDLSGTPSSLPASDVYAWAKAASKPGYSWNEISGKPTIPTDTSQLTNGAGYITGSGSCSYANSAGNANYAASAGSATSAQTATNAAYATSAGSAGTAGSSSNNYFIVGGSKYFYDNGYPYWENTTSGTAFCQVLGGPGHRYKLNWTNTDCELIIDETIVGRITLH